MAIKLSVHGLVTAAVASGILLTQETEPPLTLRVTGLEQPLVVRAGAPFELELGGEIHTLTIEVQDSRELCTPEVCLEYPSGFGFEYDPSEGSETWTLDGNDATLQVQVNPISQHPEDFADSYFGFLADLGDGEILEQEPHAIVVDGLRLKAYRAVMPWEDMEFRCDLYAVLNDKKGRWAKTFVIIQEVADRGDDEAQEVTATRELLARTLRANS